MQIYELKQKEYNFLKEVEERFGRLAQSTIFAGLCNKDRNVYVNNTIDFALDSIKSLTAEREITLIFID